MPLRNGRIGLIGATILQPKGTQKGKIEAKVHVDVQKARDEVAKGKDEEITISMQCRAMHHRSHPGQLKMLLPQHQHKLQSRLPKQLQQWPMQSG